MKRRRSKGDDDDVDDEVMTTTTMMVMMSDDDDVRGPTTMAGRQGDDGQAMVTGCQDVRGKDRQGGRADGPTMGEAWADGRWASGQAYDGPIGGDTTTTTKHERTTMGDGHDGERRAGKRR